MLNDFLRVPPLRRLTFGKQPNVGPPKSKQKVLAPAYGPRFAQVSLTPVPLRGHAVTGHPWPNTALPASMPVDPLRETSSRPPEGAADQQPSQKPDHKPDHKPDQKLAGDHACADEGCDRARSGRKTDHLGVSGFTAALPQIAAFVPRQRLQGWGFSLCLHQTPLLA